MKRVLGTVAVLFVLSPAAPAYADCPPFGRGAGLFPGSTRAASAEIAYSTFRVMFSRLAGRAGLCSSSGRSTSAVIEGHG